MGNDFESLLGELTARRKEHKRSAEKTTPPMRRELTLGYDMGKENEARLRGGEYTIRDAAALLYAAGAILGEELNLEPEELGEAFVNTAIRQAAFSGLASLLDLL